MSPEPQLTGLAKTFNSVTFTGRCYQFSRIISAEISILPRANVAKATYAGIILIVAAVKAKNALK